MVIYFDLLAIWKYVFFKRLIFSYMCVCLSVRLCTCILVMEKAKRRTLDSVGQEFQVAVSYPMWAMGTQVRSSARAASPVQCGTVSLQLPGSTF